MIVRGASGTGKSALLLALQQVFIRHGAEDCFTKTAGSHATALLIGATVLHEWAEFPTYLASSDSWLNNGTPEGAARILATSYVAIDHCSSMPYHWLDKLDARLTSVRGRAAPLNATLPFGGTSVILFEDMHQAPRVARRGWDLYYPSDGCDVRDRVSALYRLFATVISLREIHRETSWTALLNRLRIGRRTEDDRNALRAHVLSHPQHAHTDFYAGPWARAPLLATHFCMIAEWNIASVLKHRRLNGHAVYRILAVDSIDGRRLNTAESTRIFKMSPRRTAMLPSIIHVAVGAPVLVKRLHIWELATTLSIEPDALERSPIEVDQAGCLVLHRLPAIRVRINMTDEIVAVASSRGRFHLNLSERPVLRSQLLIRLGFTMFIHEAEGLTFDKLFVDVGPPKDGRQHKHDSHFLQQSALSKAKDMASVLLLTKLPGASVSRPPLDLLHHEDTLTALSIVTMVGTTYMA